MCTRYTTQLICIFSQSRGKDTYLYLLQVWSCFRLICMRSMWSEKQLLSGSQLIILLFGLTMIYYTALSHYSYRFQHMQCHHTASTWLTHIHSLPPRPYLNVLPCGYTEMALRYTRRSVGNMWYRLQLKCVPLEDLFRTKPVVKSINWGQISERARYHRLVASLTHVGIGTLIFFLI